jgi:hypothetical protein
LPYAVGQAVAIIFNLDLHIAVLAKQIGDFFLLARSKLLPWLLVHQTLGFPP